MRMDKDYDFFIGTPVILFLLMLIAGIFHEVVTSSVTFALVKGLEYAIGWYGRLATICAIGGILGCLGCRRTVFIKMWNSVVIAAISYCMWNISAKYFDFIEKCIRQGNLSDFTSMIDIGVNGLIFIFTISVAHIPMMGMIDEEGEKVY